jgi:hypothetical protein
MNTILKITAILLLAAFTSLAPAQEIKTRAQLDSAIILIGNQVNLNVEIEFPDKIMVRLLEVGDSLGKHVEILERSETDTIILENNRIRLLRNFTVTSFDTGKHEIPPFLFEFNYKDLSDTVSTNPELLYAYTLPQLDSLFTEIGGPIDIKPPYDAPVTFKEVAPWIMGILLGAALIFLILYAIKRRRNNQPIFSFPQKPKEPAHVIALRELDRIKEEKIWQQGKIKEYYSNVSDTLREYIEDRFGINAMEQTSDETIAAFNERKHLLSSGIFDNLKQMLANADLVKFAKFEPLPDDNNLLLVNAYFFVNQTKIEEKKEAAENESDAQEGEDVVIK